MDILPPLSLFKKWREEEGLSPEEIYKRCEKLYQQVPKEMIRSGKRGRKKGYKIKRLELFANCPRCPVKPYFRGLCRTCYNRLRRMDLLPEERNLIERRIKPKERTGPKKGIKKGIRPKNLEKLQFIQELREQGKTLKQISQELKISKSTIQKLLKI